MDNCLYILGAQKWWIHLLQLRSELTQHLREMFSDTGAEETALISTSASLFPSPYVIFLTMCTNIETDLFMGKWSPSAPTLRGHEFYGSRDFVTLFTLMLPVSRTWPRAEQVLDENLLNE